jgi:formate-dependent nitrite reductase membrane component NrfD
VSSGGPPAGGGRAGEADKDAQDAARRAHEEERRFAEREHRAPPPRDMTAALGTPGEPGEWRRGEEGAPVALHVGEWRDGRWSYLYGEDTQYGRDGATAVEDGLRHRGARDREAPRVVGPMIHAPVWTWEVPAYFWCGGVAAGSSFVALACDLAGDERSARIARRVSLGAVMPSPVLLIMDLGRPARFLNMLRVFKPRSPMSLGAWCLIAFSGTQTAAVGLDLLGRGRQAKAVGAASAVLGGYLGSYTGVLLASTAVPLWARSRLFLGPIFVATATATGAAATRLALVASGLPPGPTRNALGTVESAAMATELVLSTVNEKRLGELATGLERGRPGRMFSGAKWLVRAGLALRVVRGRFGRPAHDVASVMYLLAGLLFRFAWVQAGQLNARDDEVVAKMARDPEA